MNRSRFWSYSTPVQAGILLISLAVLVLFGVGVVNAGCSVDEGSALRAVEDLGMTNPREVKSGRWFVYFQGCDEKDGEYHIVRATNALNKEVELLVCCGGFMSFKGCTVRSR